MSELTAKEESWMALINKANDRLETITNDETARLPEKIFAGVFVPIFVGEESLYNATLETWVSFAGSPYRSVDVIDTRGNVLYRVPPIYERGNVKTITDSTRNNSIFKIIVTAQQYSNIHPKQGEAYLKDSLSKRSTILSSPINLAQNLEFWNMVFKRYGRPEIKVLETKATITTEDSILDMGEFESL